MEFRSRRQDRTVRPFKGRSGLNQDEVGVNVIVWSWNDEMMAKYDAVLEDVIDHVVAAVVAWKNLDDIGDDILHRFPKLFSDAVVDLGDDGETSEYTVILNPLEDLIHMAA